MRTGIAGAIVSVAVLTLPVSEASAQSGMAGTYPEEPVTVIVPWPAGGRTDLTARVTAQFLEEELGQRFLVVNKPGGGGVVGAKEVAAAEPDGYTLGVFSSGVVATQYTLERPSDLDDYDPVGLVNMDAAVVAVPARSPFQTLSDLVSYAQQNPGELTLGTATGTSAHIMGAIFLEGAQLNLRAISYGGGGERSVALAGEHIDVDIDVPAIYRSLLEADKVRLLGIGAAERSPLLPDLPTFTEQGVPVVIGTWNGLFAPKGTPPEILNTLEQALKAVTEDPKYIETMHNAFLQVRYMDPASFQGFLEEEDHLVEATVEELGLKVAN